MVGNNRTGRLVGLSTMLVVLLTVGCQAHDGPHGKTETGSSMGGWSLLGTMCFPKGTDTTLKVSVKAGAGSGSNQKILFYDDQAESWDAAVAAHTCLDKIEYSKETESGEKKRGITLKAGVLKETEITVTEKFRRQWYFVASNCAEDGTESQVDLDSFQVSSEDAIDCGLLFEQSDETGWIVASVFSSLFAIILGCTAICFYRKSKPPTMPTSGNTGYNEL